MIIFEKRPNAPKTLTTPKTFHSNNNIYFLADYNVLCSDEWDDGDNPINMCDFQIEPCVNGDCINMPGKEFRCACDIGFLVSEDQQSCVGKFFFLNRVFNILE